VQREDSKPSAAVLKALPGLDQTIAEALAHLRT